MLSSLGESVFLGMMVVRFFCLCVGLFFAAQVGATSSGPFRAELYPTTVNNEEAWIIKFNLDHRSLYEAASKHDNDITRVKKYSPEYRNALVAFLKFHFQARYENSLLNLSEGISKIGRRHAQFYFQVEDLKKGKGLIEFKIDLGRDIPGHKNFLKLLPSKKEYILDSKNDWRATIRV